MGIEGESKRRLRRSRIQKLIVTSVGAAGILSASLLAPNILAALGSTDGRIRRQHIDAISRARNNLLEKGYLRRKEGALYLTSRGERLLALWDERPPLTSAPKKWDGRWRVLIFDIPETRKAVRDGVRRTLIRFGFARIQDSVWLYPYACEDLVTLLKADLRIGKDLLYMIVDSLENDLSYRKHFRLPLRD